MSTNSNIREVRPDILAEIQLKECRTSIGMALSSYSPGTDKHSSSGVPYVIYGEHLWIFLGFTPCETVRNVLKEEYNAVFGKIIAVDSSEQTKNGNDNKDSGFSYGTPFVGIPLPQ